MRKYASALELNEVIMINRKEIQITGLVYNSGALGDYIKVSGIDKIKDVYVKPFILDLDDKLEVIA